MSRWMNVGFIDDGFRACGRIKGYLGSNGVARIGPNCAGVFLDFCAEISLKRGNSVAVRRLLPCAACVYTRFPCSPTSPLLFQSKMGTRFRMAKSPQRNPTKEEKLERT